MTKKQIILLHGAMGCGNDFQALAIALETLGFYAHSFSFSGHGTAAFDKQFGIEQFTRELNVYLTNNQFEKLPIFGYSMGAYVALYHSIQFKTTSSPIISLGTKFNWTSEGVKKEIAMLHPKTIKEKVPAYASQLQNKHGNEWETLLHRTAEMMQEIEQKQFLNYTNLKYITNKVLLGVGDQDKLVSIEETVNTHKHIPLSSLYVLPQCKHPLEMVNVSLLAEIISGFLKNTD